MADISHLEKMGRELSCPICLSLLKSSVSLACNHVFCNLCIIESMKSVSDCPVCKVPFRRREVRPAPHMDNLVTVFKNMEVAAGVNIFTTQQGPLTKNLGDVNKENGTKETPLTSRRKSKQKSLTCKAGQKLGKPAMPSFPAKKRIHVTPYPAAETPVRPKKAAKSTKISNDIEITKSLKENKRIAEDVHEGRVLSPFFWLREDNENDEETSTKTSGQLITDASQSQYVPSFSDIKDSEDDKSPIKRTDTSHLNAKDAADSEMFEWTQRACSPELCSTPLKKHTACQNKLDASQETGMMLTNEVSHTKFTKSQKAGRRNKNLSAKKHSLTKNKRLEKPRGNNLKKCNSSLHRDSLNEEHPDILVDSGEIVRDSIQEDVDDEKRNLSSHGKMFSKRSKSTTNVCQKNNSVLTVEDGNIQNEEADGDEIIEAMKKGEKPSIQAKKKCKKLLMDKAVINTQNEIPAYTKTQNNDYQKSDGTPCENVKVYRSDVEVQKAIVRESKQRRKRKTHIVDEAENDNGNEIHATSPKTFESNLGGKSFSSSKILKKGRRLPSQVICAFCHSSEDTKDSGEMMHYFNGKPVAANFNKGVNVIHSHKHCTEWAPDVYFEDDVAINLANELARSRRIKCSCCGIKGAALGCYENSCRKSFHFTCAKLVQECRWDNDNFVMLCPVHSSSKLPSEASELLKQRKRPSPNAELKTPTKCKNGHDTTQKWMRPSRSPYKWVLCCSGLTATEKGIISEFTRLTGVPISKTWIPSVTHVIASINEDGACKRTLKFLMGILDGKWILSIEWVKACLKAMQPVDEEQFEITEDVHGISGGPKLGRLRATNKEPKLFECIKFYFAGDFTPSYKGYIQDLINAAGGAILHRKPLTNDQEELFNNNSFSETLIIYSLELPEKQKVRQLEAEAIADACGATVASSSWVLDSIAASKLQPL